MNHASIQRSVIRLFFNLLIAALLVCLLKGCASPDQTLTGSQTVIQRSTNPDAARLIPRLENSVAKHLFQQMFDEELARSPERSSYLGFKGNDHLWNDRSFEHLEESLAATNTWWKKISNHVAFEHLNRQNRLSYQVLEYNTDMANQQFRFRFHDYPVNQSNGLQVHIPAFLINIHPSSSVADMEAYIQRLRNSRNLIEQLTADLEARRKLGIVLPKFILSHMISESRNILSGRPFDFSEQDSVLLADFRVKLNNLGLIESKKQQLLADMSTALIQFLKPAYTTLINYLLELDDIATNEAGVWRFPNGEAFYRQQLRFHTTTAMTPEQIHNVGLKEVARIQAEILDIIRQVNFDGDLQAFFEFVRQEPGFYFPTSEHGKQAYLTGAVKVLSGISERLGELSLARPGADLIVKAVESFRERSAGTAFYRAPSIDGSRPGIYYVNFFDLGQLPEYELQAQTYHGGIPGHHLERSFSQQLDHLPDFRRFGSYTAFSEGWGLYMAHVPKQLGLYSDPYSDFGRLARELWYACRLVADTGMHWKRWSREQAIEYLNDNTASVYTRNVKAVERSVVMPGEAPAATIGKLKFLELQNNARDNLGEEFNISEYHHFVLANGPLPLALLTTVVDRWIEDKTE